MEPKILPLKGLEHVRRKPGMYIGRTDEANECVFELISNSLQEHFEGRGNRITITLHDDESLSVTDEGGGISVALDEKSQIPFVELAMTHLFVPSHWRKRPYDLGLCGVGTKCVNAVSEWMRINTVWEGSEYQIGFARGGVSEPLTKLPKAERASGTSIRFKPDASIFRSTSFNRDYLNDRLDQLAVLHPKLSIVLADERPNVSGQPLASLFHYPDGIRGYLRRYSHPQAHYWEPVVVLDGDVDGVKIALGFEFLDFGNPWIVSYVNSSPTVSGGTHVEGMLESLAKKINELAGKDRGFSLEDVRVNVTAFVAVWLAEPKYGGATKNKIINPEVETAVKELTMRGLDEWPGERPDRFIDWLEERRVGLKREEE
jgi:DNA gyrase subunit B